MVRDEELNRLIRYAQGMGLSVRFKPYTKKNSSRAEWAIDGTEITVYLTNRSSKLEKILSLIHELGHHKSFIASGRSIDPNVDKALDSQDEETSEERRHIWEMESQDSEYWEQIYKDTNCTFGLDILKRQREYDVWVYHYWYENGKWPTKAIKIDKRRELRKKHR